MITIRLPVPPSVNQLYRNVKGRGRVKTEAYRNWIFEACQWQHGQKAYDGLAGRYRLSITVPAKARADLGNLEKAISDFLQSRLFIKNDRMADEINLKRDPDLDGYCLVTISESAA